LHQRLCIVGGFVIGGVVEEPAPHQQSVDPLVHQGDELGHLCRRRLSDGVEGDLAVWAFSKGAVQDEGVKMEVAVQSRAESLRHHHGAGLARWPALCLGAPFVPPENDTKENPRHGRAKRRCPRCECGDTMNVHAVVIGPPATTRALRALQPSLIRARAPPARAAVA